MNWSYINKASVGWNYLLKRTALPAGHVIGFTIEPTNICNLRCVYCPQSDEANHFINGKGFMAFETYKKVLDNLLDDFRPAFVSLHRDVEPMLNRDLDSFVEYTVSKGIKTIMSSNCTLLSPERASRLLECGMSLIKTDFCADKRLYEELRVGANWEKTYEGMLTILSLARDTKKPFQLNITDLSTHGVPEAVARKNMAALAGLFADYKTSVLVTRVHFHNALDESVRAMSRKNERADQYTLCHHPWVHIVVDFKGNVVPCCRDLRSEYPCGNLLEKSMRLIWNDRPFLELRTALKNRTPQDIGICGKCDLPYAGSYSGFRFTAKMKNLLFSRMWRR
jgi:radical SAM protein with 4Fe4S-binding SPASM domain